MLDLYSTICTFISHHYNKNVVVKQNHTQRLGIEFLRSPAIAHPDQFDMRALLAYAVANDREDELIESGCSEIRKVSQDSVVGKSNLSQWLTNEFHTTHFSSYLDWGRLR